MISLTAIAIAELLVSSSAAAAAIELFANLIEQFFVSPHHVGYHLEHHLYPGVPYYNLHKLHQLLMERAEYQEKAHVTVGYFTGLFDELAQEVEGHVANPAT